MKTFLKWITLPVAAAMLLVAAPTKTEAGHGDGEKAAAIFAGVAAIGIIAALASQQHCEPPPPARCGPPPPPPPRWVPGHYETQREQVCIPGYWDTVTEPAQYGWVRHGCRWEYVMIKTPCTRRVWVPERTEWRETRVWVPGQYEAAAPVRHARAY